MKGGQQWGRGYLYRRGRIWWIQYHVNGRPYRESTGTADRALARRLLDIRLGEAAKGSLVRPGNRQLRIPDLLELVWRDYRVNDHKSLERLQYSARALITHFGRARALSVGPVEIQRYILRRQDAGAANATINRELAALRRGYTLAYQAGLMPVMPAIKPLRERNVRTGFFEESDFLAMRRHLPSEIQAVVTFAYITGWRIQSEVLPLQWRQVDFPGALVILEPGTTKNDAGRTFPLIPALRTLLETQLERTRALERARHQIIPWVFHRAGRSIRDFQRAWDTACRKAGLAGRIPHDLRRTAVRNLVRAGVPERVAMALTGHKTRSVFDRYNIVSEGDLREAGKRLASGIRHNLDTIERVERDPRELSR